MNYMILVSCNGLRKIHTKMSKNHHSNIIYLNGYEVLYNIYIVNIMASMIPRPMTISQTYNACGLMYISYDCKIDDRDNGQNNCRQYTNI